MTYFCCDCHTMFTSDTAGYYREDPSPPGVGLPLGYETYMVCPECGGDGYEVVRCDDDCEYCEYARWCDECCIEETDDEEENTERTCA